MVDKFETVSDDRDRGEALMILRDNQEYLNNRLDKLIKMLDDMFRHDPLVRFQGKFIKKFHQAFHQELHCSADCKHFPDSDPRKARF